MDRDLSWQWTRRCLIGGLVPWRDPVANPL